MVYIPNAQDVTRPISTDDAGDMATELRSLKAYLQSLVIGGSNFFYAGSFRNRLRNGSFDIQPTGTSFSVFAAETLLVNKWKGYGDASGFTVSVAGGPGSSGGPIGGDYYMALTGNTGNTTASLYQQIAAIDTQDLVVGTTVTISGMYNTTKVNAPTLTLVTPNTTIDTYDFYTGVTPTVSLSISNPKINTWQSFSYTATLTVAATKGLQIAFNWPLGITSQTHNFSKLQVEVGTYATPFEKIPYGVEVASIAFANSKLLPFMNYGTGSIVTFVSTSSLQISAGQWTDSTNSYTINIPNLTKRTDSLWTTATGTGGMGVGLTVAASTSYHIIAILFPSGVTSYYYDTSPTAAHAPAGILAYRRIFSFKTDSSALIIAFVQNGDRVDLLTPISEVSLVPGTTAAVTKTLTGCPTGVVMQPILGGQIFDAVIQYAVVYISSLTQTDITPTNGAFTVAMGTYNTVSAFSGLVIVTNTSGQIRYRVTTTTVNLTINTHGWIDRRGRDG